MLHGLKINFKNLYRQMLWTYLPLVTVCLIGTATVIVLVNGNYFTREMDKMRQVTLNTAADVLDEKISGLYDVLFQLAMNGSVIRYSKIPAGDLSYEEVRTIQNVRESIRNALASNATIQEIFLYLIDRDTVFSSQYRGQGLIPLDNDWTFFNEIFSGMTRDEVCNTLKTVSQRCFLILKNEGNPFPVLATPIPIVSSGPDMVLALIINSGELGKLSALTLGSRENLLITDQAGKIIFSLNGAGIGLSIADTHIVGEKVLGKHALYRKESIHKDIVYYYLTDQTYMQVHTNVIVLYSILIICVALAIISLLVLLVSWRIYTPIRSILGILPAKPAGLQTADTDLIRDSITAMRQNIRSIRPYAFEQLLFKMLRDDISADKAQQVMKELSVSFHREHALVCMLRLTEYAQLIRQFSESVITGIKEKITAEIVKALSDTADSTIISDLKDFYLVFNYDLEPKAFEDLLTDRLLSVQRQLLADSEIKMKIAIGAAPWISMTDNPKVLMDVLQESLVSAKQAMEHLFFASDGPGVLRSSAQIPAPVNFYAFSRELEQDIANCLFTGQKDLAVQKAGKLILENMAGSQCHYANMKHLLNDLLSVATRTLLNTRSPLDRVLKPRQELYAGCEDCDSLEEATAYIFDVYRSVADFFRSENGRWPSTRDSVLAYIRENIGQPLSVKDIATHFKLSKGYYCQIFREMTGMTTLEFINRCRIEKAQELILEDRFPLKAIAYQVGINNYNTFIRLFKKHTLCTPGGYKRKIG
jgi:AraC-like DNA-binding protein